MVHTRRLRAAATVAAVAAVAGGLLGGCSGSTASGPATGQPPATPAAGQRHNQADVAFLQDIIPHHTQAITMSDLAHTKATSLRVKAIAVRIRAEQDQQITRAHDLLGAWGAPMPAGGSGNGQVPGMLSDQQIQQLKSATGDDFDQTFLRLMIDHQKGAIQLAQTELVQGSDPQARRLAQDIITGQQNEVNQMQKLLRPT
jgi:uncharacterized protein (DUF305 family)